MYKIPLFDLNYDEDEVQAVTEVIRAKWISSGPKCQKLEEMFCELLGAKHAYAVASCTGALHLALCALDIREGDEVLVPSLTFVATANAVKYVGATPVFCDIVSAQDLTISPEEIEKKITDKTKAIMVMHYAGFSCDMDSVMAIAKKHHLYVIEDACHGPLSEYHGRKLGTIGDVGCFSFFSNKNISTGEGGMLVTNSDEVGEKVKLLKSHGMTTMSYERSKGHSTSYDVVELGYNYRLDDMRAALAISQLNKLPKDYEKRKLLREHYLERLVGCGALWVPFAERGEYVSNYIFSIVLKDSCYEERDRVREQLQERGIQTSVHYPAAHRFHIYEEDGKVSLPVTEYVTDCEITLPLYGKLSIEEVDYICDSLLEIVRNK